MELDDFKHVAFSSSEGKEHPDKTAIDCVRDQVRAKTRKQKQRVIWFAGFFLLISVGYLFLGLANRNNGPASFFIGMSLLAVGLLCGAGYFYLKSRMLKDDIYTLPLTEFLSQTEKQLQYIRAKEWLILLPLLLLLGTGGGMVFISRLMRYTDNMSLLVTIWILFYISLCIFGTIAGKKDWYKEHGPLLSEIKRLNTLFQ